MLLWVGAVSTTFIYNEGEFEMAMFRRRQATMTAAPTAATGTASAAPAVPPRPQMTPEQAAMAAMPTRSADQNKAMLGVYKTFLDGINERLYPTDEATKIVYFRGVVAQYEQVFANGGNIDVAAFPGANLSAVLNTLPDFEAKAKERNNRVAAKCGANKAEDGYLYYFDHILSNLTGSAAPTGFVGPMPPPRVTAPAPLLPGMSPTQDYIGHKKTYESVTNIKKIVDNRAKFKRMSQVQQGRFLQRFPDCWYAATEKGTLEAIKAEGKKYTAGTSARNYDPNIYNELGYIFRDTDERLDKLARWEAAEIKRQTLRQPPAPPQAAQTQPRQKGWWIAPAAAGAAGILTAFTLAKVLTAPVILVGLGAGFAAGLVGGVVTAKREGQGWKQGAWTVTKSTFYGTFLGAVGTVFGLGAGLLGSTALSSILPSTWPAWGIGLANVAGGALAGAGAGALTGMTAEKLFVKEGQRNYKRAAKYGAAIGGVLAFLGAAWNVTHAHSTSATHTATNTLAPTATTPHAGTTTGAATPTTTTPAATPSHAPTTPAISHPTPTGPAAPNAPVHPTPTGPATPNGGSHAATGSGSAATPPTGAGGHPSTAHHAAGTGHHHPVQVDRWMYPDSVYLNGNEKAWIFSHAPSAGQQAYYHNALHFDLVKLHSGPHAGSYLVVDAPGRPAFAPGGVNLSNARTLTT
ncbi:MAG: hypothetical protein P4M13_03660 [Alphaproteobacteria bacterium]|nr:hypothetical protein [Alphaproteobacteria bacterium]